MEFQPNNPLQVIMKMLLDEISAARSQRQQVVTRPNNMSMAKYILDYTPNTQVVKNPTVSGLYSNKEHQSVVNKIFAFLSRPLNAVTSGLIQFEKNIKKEKKAGTLQSQESTGLGRIPAFFEDIIGGFAHTNVPKEMLEGIKGNRLGNTYSDVIATSMDGKRTPLTAALGGALDLTADPLLLLPVGKLGKLALTPVDKASKLMRNFEAANRSVTVQTAERISKALRDNPYIVTAEQIVGNAPKIPRLNAPIQGLKGIAAPGQIPAPIMRAPRDFTGTVIPREQAISSLATKYPKLNFAIGQNTRLSAIAREAGKKHAATGAREAAEAQSLITPAQRIIESIADNDPSAIMRVLPKSTGALGNPTSLEIERALTIASQIKKFDAQTQVGVFRKLYNVAARAGASERALAELGKRPQRGKALATYQKKLANLEKKYVTDPGIMAKASNSARRMLFYLTNHLDAQGIRPLGLNDEYLRLSDFINEYAASPFVVGTGFGAKTEIGSSVLSKFLGKDIDVGAQQAFENLRARRMVGQSGSLAAVAGATNTRILDSKKLLHPAIAKMFNDQLAKQAEKVVLGELGGVPVEAKAIRELAERLTSPTDLRDIAVKANASGITTAMGKGVTYQGAITSLTQAIEKTRGFHYEEAARALASEPKAHVWDAFLDRMTTFNGIEDVRPVARTYVDSAKASAALMADVLHPLTQKFNQSQLAEAWKHAQGMLPELSDPALEQASKTFKGAMGWLFKVTGLSEDASRVSSIAYRSNLVMKDLNKELEQITHGRMFNFSAGVKKNPLTGEKINFGEYGTKWLESWIMHQVDDPIEYVYQMSLAVQRVTTRYAFLDEAAARFGTKVARGNVEVAHHRLSGVYFSPEIGGQITKTLRRMDEFYTPASPGMRSLAAVMSVWKRWVTIMRPGHHTRNIIGDWFNAYLDGVFDPKYYRKAMQVVKAHRQFYKDALKDQNYEALEKLIGRPNMDMSRKIADLPGDKILKTRGGIELSNEQIYLLAHRKGILPRAAEIEDIYGGPAMVSSRIGTYAKKARELSPFQGKITDAAAHFSELREHWMRLGHFIGALEQSTLKDLDKLAEEAALRVKKWHPDGTDLTAFEQKVRQVIPFYSWNRKIVPLMIEGLIQKPGHILSVAKVPYSIQEILGMEPESYGNPFTGDQLYPEWIRASGIGPIGDPTLDGIPGWLGRLGRSPVDFMGNPNQNFTTVVNPGTPFTDTLAQYTSSGGFGSGVGGLLAPWLRIPAELLMNQTMLSQRPIFDRNTSTALPRYILEQIPVAADLARTTSFGRPDQTGALESIINYLTGAGIRGTGVYQKTAQFERKQG